MKSLNRIYEESNYRWFRVRDVNTLKDYLLVEFISPPFNNPDRAKVICCEDQKEIVVDSKEEKYALISSPEELKNYRRKKLSEVKEMVRKGYEWKEVAWNIDLYGCE